MTLLSMPPLTLWQFYAQAALQLVLGVGFVALMIWLGQRNPRLGWKSPTWMAKIRNGIAVVLIFMAGIASYDTFPSLFHAFTSDVADTVVDTGVDVVTKAINGSTEQGIVEPKHVADPSTPIWGEPNTTQNETVMLLAGFWICLGWWCYLMGFNSSYVPLWKKALKIVAYLPLIVPLAYWPMKLHYFNWDELKYGIISLVIAGVLIVVTHDFSPAPPKLPGLPKLPVDESELIEE